MIYLQAHELFAENISCFSWKWAYFSILFASIQIYRPSRVGQYLSLVPTLSVN